MANTGSKHAVHHAGGSSWELAFVALLGVSVVAIGAALALGRRLGREALVQRLHALATRLGADPPEPAQAGVEAALDRLEQVTARAAEAVAESSADAIRFKRALDALSQGVIVCNEAGEVAFRNARAAALMSGRHGDALAAQAVVRLLEQAWRTGSAEQTLELYGPPRQTLTIRTAVIDDGRRALGVIAVIDDVSERRRLEEIRRDFVANVSHELKTPMGALGLLAETLLAEPDPTVARRLAERIHSEAFRVSRIIEDLLDLSRIEAEEAPPRELLPLDLVVGEAIERVRAALDPHGVALRLMGDGAGIVVRGDRRQLVSALYNLLENAVKFSQSGSAVELAVVDEGEEVHLVVTDHGIGIPASELERIFERFYRVDQGRGRTPGGTGLGLAIVRHVAQNHGGRVEVRSREGEGSTFRLILPVAARTPVAPSSEPAPAAQARSDPTAGPAGAASGTAAGPGAASDPTAGPAGITAHPGARPEAPASDPAAGSEAPIAGFAPQPEATAPGPAPSPAPSGPPVPASSGPPSFAPSGPPSPASHDRYATALPPPPPATGLAEP